ncbi:MAG: indole-3-glycerol phosphate synthase TrpC [Ktedonobacterales bacterium]|nr:indole-3-glycerol phosphate synthase TrpC [Ktedonobacterales bacterium]
MTDSIFARIVAATERETAERKAHMPLREIQAQAGAAPPPRDFASALRYGSLHSGEESDAGHLIAEIKRASPSKGVLVQDFDPVAQARAYVAGGAAAISVLTEPRFFLGALDHLSAVRAAVSVPLLRKDFLTDPYQIYEARAAGADAVLLLCALLDDAGLRELLALARSLGMEALVEAHDAKEVGRAVAVGAQVIGVNSRDLRTFAVDVDTMRHLRPLVPADRIFVAESGIGDARAATQARLWGADAILVGEALMRASHPATKTRELVTALRGHTSLMLPSGHYPFIKICGITHVVQALCAGQLGANAIGLVFAESHRRITPEHAGAIIEEVEDAAGQQPKTQEAQRWTAPLSVGVFVNEPADHIARIADTASVDVIQLSGDESPADCAEVVLLTGLMVVKALRPRATAELAALDAYVQAGATLLLDTPKAGRYGGTGETGDWALARVAARRWPIMLSGGLTPENVAAAVVAVGACAVDVSSGVETNRAKDLTKIARFIAAARGATGDGDPADHEDDEDHPRS